MGWSTDGGVADSRSGTFFYFSNNLRVASMGPTVAVCIYGLQANGAIGFLRRKFDHVEDDSSLDMDDARDANSAVWLRRRHDGQRMIPIIRV